MKIKDWLTEDRWIQGHLGKYSDGFYFNCSGDFIYQNPTIKQVCLLGAIYFCYPWKEVDRIKGLLEKELAGSITNWNDSDFRTWEHIHSLVKDLDI